MERIAQLRAPESAMAKQVILSIGQNVQLRIKVASKKNRDQNIGQAASLEGLSPPRHR